LENIFKKKKIAKNLNLDATTYLLLYIGGSLTKSQHVPARKGLVLFIYQPIFDGIAGERR